MHSAEVVALALVFEKSDTEPKPNLLGKKNIINIANLNFTTLNTINQLPEFTAVESRTILLNVLKHRCYAIEQELKYHDTSNG